MSASVEEAKAYRQSTLIVGAGGRGCGQGNTAGEVVCLWCELLTLQE